MRRVSGAYAWDPTEPVATRPLMLQVPDWGSTLFYAHDGNKNVSEVFYYALGNGIGAHYDYAPFGAVARTAKATSVARDILSENPFRFSSEVHDNSLGLVCCNYRHYNPKDGRWLGRDPIEEFANINLYGYLLNRVLEKTDLVGLVSAQEVKDLIGEMIEILETIIKNGSIIKIEGELLRMVSEEPKVRSLGNLVRDDIKTVIEQRRCPEVILPIRYFVSTESRRELIAFGGERAPANMWEQFKGFWKEEYRATWEVAASPLTWLIRNTHVNASGTATVEQICTDYSAFYTISFNFLDTLDLRPREHDNHDWGLVLSPAESPYDAATVVLGTLWHDVLRRRDDIRVEASWTENGYFKGSIGDR